MRITEEQSRALLAKRGVYVTEVCDCCGKLLGHVRFTRYGERVSGASGSAGMA